MARILVVDDEKAMRDLLSGILRQAGHEVEVAIEGQHGLELYQTEPADLVFTDIAMPAKDGLQLIRELKNQNPDVKVFVITAAMKSVSKLQMA